MTFLIDAQLPPALARWLLDAGREASHLQDMGLRDADDGMVWATALRIGAAIVTKDEDFAARSVRSKEAPIIVWLRVGNTTNPVLKTWIDARLPGILQLLEQGNRLVEVV
jgi:predicted nuclease of predicted toxin-antitoxin system